MKLTIYRYPEKEEEMIGIIDLKDRYCEMWYKEIMNRFREHKNNVFDIDESYELGQMSLGHLSEMILFLNKDLGKK